MIRSTLIAVAIAVAQLSMMPSATAAQWIPTRADSAAPHVVNNAAWAVFERSHNRDTLVATIRRMQQVLPEVETDLSYFQYLDTYANLLYKAGHADEAVRWQEKAVAEAKRHREKGYANIPLLEATLGKMRSGQPTWPVLAPP